MTRADPFSDNSEASGRRDFPDSGRSPIRRRGEARHQADKRPDAGAADTLQFQDDDCASATTSLRGRRIRSRKGRRHRWRGRPPYARVPGCTSSPSIPTRSRAATGSTTKRSPSSRGAWSATGGGSSSTSDGAAITQREVPALTGLRATVTPDGGLRLSLPGRDDLTIAEPVLGPMVPISVFAYRGQATLADPKAQEWLTAGLGRPVRLVWQDDPGRRAPDSPNARPGDRMVFQDDFPVSLANLASLAALNDLIAESGSVEGPLPITRFRPNIVLAGAEPWAEDTWTGGRLRIGEATFHVPEGSGRCLVTTTDQETGERGHEPLRTLGRHRNVDQRILFATLLVPEGPAKVLVGDTLVPL